MFPAAVGADDLTVCEGIHDARGESWPDVSAWYWSAIRAATPAPWGSFAVANRNRRDGF
jgi:hypothetical protein